MEVSPSVLLGLQAASSSAIADTVFLGLMTRAIQAVLTDEGELQSSPSLSEVEPTVTKEAFFALTTLVLEAARTDADSPAISAVLEECKFTPDRIQAFTTLYNSYKTQLRATLARVGPALSHVVDVKWRLDYYLKNNHVERVNRPVYLIDLKLQEDHTNAVQFACTQEQLQDLVSKLKDAGRSLEKFSQ